MQLLKYEEIDHSKPCREFRNQSWLPLFWLCVFMGAVALFVLLPKRGNPGGGWWALPPALLTGFFLVLMLERLRICRKAAGWLLRAGPEGLFINLRSCLNYHLPPETHRVLFVSKEEIAAIVRTRETSKVPDRRGSHTDRYTFIDIHLNHDQLAEVAEALRRERRLEPAPVRLRRAKRHDYPVRLLRPQAIRLVWDWMRPGEQRALNLLGEYFPIAPDQQVLAKTWEKMGPEEREALLLQYWEWGHVEDAVRMAKMHWQLGDFRAKARLKELVRQADSQ